MEIKVCSKCSQSKEASIAHYQSAKSTLDKLSSWCRECHKSYQKAYRESEKSIKTPIPDGIKQCSRCSVQKPYADFSPNLKLKSKMHSSCRSCQKEYQQERNDVKRPQKIYPCPKEGHKFCTNCDVEKPESLEFFHKFKTGKNGLNSACKICSNKKNRDWAKANPEKSRESDKRRYQRQVKKGNISARKKFRLKTDPAFRASVNIRNRTSQLLKDSSYGYSTSIGCSQKELKVHLESQFQPGMTWDNYGNKIGQWNIDHKYPLAVALQEGPESYAKACHYTNLQPMWAIENCKKHKKIV